MKLQDLGKAYSETRLQIALQSLRKEEAGALQKVAAVRIGNVALPARKVLADAVYQYGKITLAEGVFDRAKMAFHLAHDIEPASQVFATRKRLIDDAATERTPVQWRVSLISMQRQLKIVCSDNPSRSDTHYSIARGQRLVGEGLRDIVDGIDIHTLAPYYPRWMGDAWTRILKAIKKQNQSDLLEPVANILADFLLTRTTLLRTVDLIVPIPPSTTKFSDRGFAPNDLIARRLERALGLPAFCVLNRRPGLATRDASAQELNAQFHIDSGHKKIEGQTVLLAEDIWTRGRTISFCARKLLDAGASHVAAVALGRTSGR